MKQREVFHKFPHWLQSACLFLVFIGGLLVCGNTAAILSVLFFGADALSRTFPLLFVQAFSAVGGFLLPSLWFAGMQRAGRPDFLRARKGFPPKILLFALLAYLTLCPFISAMQEWNANWHFPESWHAWEDFFREKSLRLEQTSQRMLSTRDPLVFACSLLVTAVGTGVCEEFFFRGCLQNIFKSWFRNRHAAVWTAAAIFSLFHGDLFGFLPRLFLGAFLGYVYVWSGSIWPPVIVHSLNNAIIVVVHFLSQNRLLPFDIEKLEQSPHWLIVIPCLLVCGLIFRKMATGSKEKPFQSID